MIVDPKIFKAYDIRGIYPTEINEDAVYRIAQAYAKFIKPKTVALGRDVRASGPALFESVQRALLDHGVDVVDIGVITTDMLYFAVAHYGYDGGITISASHNPREYNGLKLVRQKAEPISGDSGIGDMREIALSGYSFQTPSPGKIREKSILADYLQKCLLFVDVAKLKPMKIVANAMFGPAVQNVLKMQLPMEIVPLNEVPDGTFPKGAPDPLLAANRVETTAKIRQVKADLGAAWDADADRFFLFDETGRWIPGYYLTAFLGEYFSRQTPGTKIISDTRLVWAIRDKVEAAGGIPLQNKAGHSFIKERMRREDAVFGGEMSGHYYFKDFFYADNGLIPFLLMLKIISEQNKKVSELFDEYFDLYHISEEINHELKSLDQGVAIFQSLKKAYADAKFDETDGLSLSYPDWRANVRGSNTQPLLRLNIEAVSRRILKEKTDELLNLIKK